MSSTKTQREFRVPVQERSATRMAKVLEAAERMLGELGPEKTSIPALAEAAEVPRAAIYPFFPDKYALFAHLTRVHLERLGETLVSPEMALVEDWRTWVMLAIRVTADYYNAHPAAAALLFSGSYANSDHEAHALKNTAIGALLRQKAASLGQLKAMPTSPDVATIAVEIVFACTKYGYGKEGTVSDAICSEAFHAVTAYLARWEDAT